MRNRVMPVRGSVHLRISRIQAQGQKQTVLAHHDLVGAAEHRLCVAVRYPDPAQKRPRRTLAVAADVDAVGRKQLCLAVVATTGRSRTRDRPEIGALVRNHVQRVVIEPRGHIPAVLRDA